MYVFVDKKTRAVIHVASVSNGDDRKPGEIFRGYDPQTMDVGHAPDQFIPARFDIKDGIVVDLDPRPAPTLEEVRAARLRWLTDLALSERDRIAPDYQLLNAGLGLYDAARTQALRATVQAFRDEVHRVEAAIAKAQSVKEIESLKPVFPTALLHPPAPPPPQGLRVNDPPTMEDRFAPDR